MTGIWSNDPATREGKYPVTLRRDGTQVEFPSFTLNCNDPGFPAAMRAYALMHDTLGSDPQYVMDCFVMADKAASGGYSDGTHKSDPDAARHRTDDPLTLLFSRLSEWRLADFVETVHDHLVRHSSPGVERDAMRTWATAELARMDAAPLARSA